MKVSVLIPVYKVEKYIQRCLKSVLEQTYKNLEVIVVDDASPDNSVLLLNVELQKYPQRIKQVKVIKHDRNLGLAQARNTALRAATGDYVFNIDSDDYLLENTAIESFVNIAVENNADIVEGDFVRIYSENVRVNETIKRNYEKKEKLIECIITKKNNFTVWNKLIKRDLYVLNDIYVPSGINYGEDYVTCPRLYYYAAKIAHLQSFTYGYNLENTTSFYANRTNWGNLYSMHDSNRFLYDFFQRHNERKLVMSIQTMYLEVKVHLLLHCQNKDDIKNIEKLFYDCRYRYAIFMRKKFLLVLMLEFFRTYPLLYKIGNMYRNM